MKRLTFEGRFCDLAMCLEPHPCKYHDAGCSQRNTWERLKAIEDILGEDYDLDRLRELVEADRDLHVELELLRKIGSTVYRIRRNLDGSDSVRKTELWWSDIPEIGKTVFLTREEAEAALERMAGE